MSDSYNCPSCGTPIIEHLGLYGTCAALQALKQAVKETLEDNCHLADGENCTLIKLKKAFEKLP